MAQHPLMPKATAVWLIDNTALTFEQISEFCGLHKLEVQAIADGEIGTGIIGINPVTSQELTAEEIRACEQDPKRPLKMMKTDLPQPKTRTKGPRYTPVAKRADKPNGIAWLLKHHPELADSQIAKLIGTTKPTIQAIRDKTHVSMTQIKPQDPVLLGLCKRADMQNAIERAQRKLEKEGKSLPKPAAAEEKAEAAVADKPAPTAAERAEERKADEAVDAAMETMSRSAEA
ncbi:MAG: DUF1013 domain-containing protein [Micavibrio sp.]|nr:MAG: DUF1013 domain-containing protein [Micavibrio sp.]